MGDHFIRGLIYDTGTANNAKVSAIMKMIYEFWGFAINGTSSLLTPGGFAATTPSTMPNNFNGVQTTIAGASNGQTLPQTVISVASTAAFPVSGTIYVYTTTGTQTVTYTGGGGGGTTFTGCSGGTGTMTTGNNVTSSSLITIGSDGYTNATTAFRYDGANSFFASSGPFTAGMIGKIISIWIPGSGSSEDSVYKIIGFNSPSEIVIGVNTGGVPSEPDGYKPSFTNRSGINYRVTDVNVAAGTTADGNYFVMQLNPVNVNTGQANSQVQLLQATTNLVMNAVLSPGGTWTGSAFTDGTTTISPNYGNTLNSTSGTGKFAINMWGDIDYLIYENSWESNTYNHSVHLEIPKRIYTQTQDLNPICISLNGRNTVDNIKITSNNTTSGWGGGFVMKCADGVTRKYRTSVKALIGDGNAANTISNVANPPGNTLTDFRAGANPMTGNILNSVAVLTLPGVAGQYSLGRVLLRKVRFTNTFMPTFYRFNSGNDFISLTQGVALPWDKTVLPFTLFPF